MSSSLIERDLKHIWHPCSQMKDYDSFKPIEVTKAYGSYIELKNGKRVIDAISSWWCKSLGHQHPRLKNALIQQMEKFEHVILANTTNDTIVELSEKLAALTNTLNKVFYASDGSCAVEIAMKMSLHSREISGEKQRNIFFSLENGYHGETLGALSVSDLGIYRSPYSALLFDAHFLSPLPYVNSVQDPLWTDCKIHWEHILEKLEPWSERITAILVEPILQGAGGMKIYSQDFLKRLRKWSQERNIHLIADEIMTGMGRTGKMLACEHAGIEPDFLCLSKGLTSGWLPLSVVLTHENIYQLFYDDYANGKSFLHSHTYSGNALAASVALEVLRIYAENNIPDQANRMGSILFQHMQDIAYATKKLINVRSIGGMVAADLFCDSKRRAGFDVFRQAMELGVLLRPLGNTIYWLPPLTTEIDVLNELKEKTEQALLSIEF